MIQRSGYLHTLLLALLGGFLMHFSAAAEAAWKTTPIHEAITAQEGWLNTSRALTPEDLAGRLILLDFWTFCCINCMHVIPDLHYLEQKFGDKLTVIGVHSAKFRNEQDTENIRQAILRYDIEHPVVNDFDFTIWQRFGVRAWPTFILIRPDGRMVNLYSGEGNRAEVEADIQTVLAQYKGSINRSPLPLSLEKNRAPASALSFPGKLAYVPDLNGKPALLVSDSGHQRILVLSPEGKVLEQIGSGKKGKADGDFESATFFGPQGMAYDHGVLYIADTENHLIRAADFATRKVTTIAGTGVQSFDRSVQDAPARVTALSSPWDLAFYPDKQHLVIAMAGMHQLWQLNLNDHTLSVIAGSGRESIDDGEYPHNSLSQPSGLSVIGDKLYFVDAETSSLRVLDKQDVVSTLIGTGLFDFGYREGKRDTALMQHSLGLFADQENIYIADSYNHSIRRYDPASGELHNFAGNGMRGHDDGALAAAQFNEPNAIIRAGDLLYVADTNNNRIRAIDIKADRVRTLDIQEAKKANVDKVDFSKALPNVVAHQDAALRADSSSLLKLQLAPGWKINHDAPSYLALFAIIDTPALVHSWDAAQVQSTKIMIPALKEGIYRLQGTFYYCEEKEGSECLVQSVDMKVNAAKAGNSQMVLEIKPPQP